MLGREVDVDVRGARHFVVQEPFEQEVVLDGVDARDPEHVRDDRVGGGTSALAGHAVLTRESHEVPVDQEELRQPGLLDHLELALKPLSDRERDRQVPGSHALETELVQKRERRLAFGDRVAGEADLAKVEVEVALTRDFPGRGQRRSVAFEQGTHLVATFEAVLGVGEEERARLIEGGAMPDGDQHVVKWSPLA